MPIAQSSGKISLFSDYAEGNRISPRALFDALTKYAKSQNTEGEVVFRGEGAELLATLPNGTHILNVPYEEKVAEAFSSSVWHKKDSQKLLWKMIEGTELLIAIAEDGARWQMFLSHGRCDDMNGSSATLSDISNSPTELGNALKPFIARAMDIQIRYSMGWYAADLIRLVNGNTILETEIAKYLGPAFLATSRYARDDDQGTGAILEQCSTRPLLKDVLTLLIGPALVLATASGGSKGVVSILEGASLNQEWRDAVAETLPKALIESKGSSSRPPLTEAIVAIRRAAPLIPEWGAALQDAHL